MNNDNNFVAPVITGLIAAIGTWLVGWSGLLKTIFQHRKVEAEVALKKDHETHTASDLIIKEALSLVEVLSSQVKDLRSENLSIEQQQAHENILLRERIRLLEQRISDLELKNSEKEFENVRLKSQLYDMEKRFLKQDQ